MLIAAAMQSFAETRYVSLNGGNVSPFTNWTDAATTIQSALSVSATGDVVVVTNGLYYSVSELIVVAQGIEIRSVNGPEFTFVQGGIDRGCGSRNDHIGLIIRQNGTVRGFTIQKSVRGVDMSDGLLDQCIVKENDTRSGDACGGGNPAAGVNLNRGTVQNCLIIKNHAGSSLYGTTLGHGAGIVMATGTIINCTIAGNSSTRGVRGSVPQGGGLYASAGTVINTIIVSNYVDGAQNNYAAPGSVVFDHTCAFPLPVGVGNVAADPQFLDFATDNFRLAQLSPCLDTAATGTTNDLVNRPRPIDGNMDSISQWDMGAYERACDDVADLGVALVALTEPVILGSNFFLRAVISNSGPDTVSATASLFLPTGLIIHAISSSTGTFSNQAGLVRGEMTTFTSGAHADVTVEVQAVTAGPFSNRLAAYSSGCDSQTVNDSTIFTTHVTPPAPDLVISKTTSDGGPGLNRPYFYYIGVSNNGPDAAVGFSVTDAVPPEVSIQVVTASGGFANTDGNTVYYSHGFLPVGGSVQLQIKASIGTLLWITNTAILYPRDNDPVATNNESRAAVHGRNADLSAEVTRTDAARAVRSEHLVTVSNAGPDTASNAFVRVTSTERVISIASAYSYSTSGPYTVIFSLGLMNPGDAKSVRVTTRTFHANSFETDAIATSDVPDVVTGNNTGRDDLFGRVFDLSDADFDGDFRTDHVVFEPSSGKWFIRRSSSGQSFSLTFGSSSIIPAVGDFDGDFECDLATYYPKNGLWTYRRNSNGATIKRNWGGPSMIPVHQYYDDDRITDLAVYDKSSGYWYIMQSLSGTSRVQQWGGPGLVPTPGDYDGDGIYDVAVFQRASGNWFIRRSSDNTTRVQNWGWPAVMPAPADFDGDGITDLAVYHPASGNWYIIDSNSGLTRIVHWGWSATYPVPADYDADGFDDIAVYHKAAGDWFVRKSSDGQLQAQHFGTSKRDPTLLQYQINKRMGLIP